MSLVTLTGYPKLVGLDGTTYQFVKFPDKEPAATYLLRDETYWIETTSNKFVASEGIKRSRPRFSFALRGLSEIDALTVISICEQREVTYFPRTKLLTDDPLESEVGFLCHVKNAVRNTQMIKRGKIELQIELEAAEIISSKQTPIPGESLAITIDNSQITRDLNGFVGTVDLSDYPMCSKFWDNVAQNGGNLRVFDTVGVELPIEALKDFDRQNRTGRLFFKFDLLAEGVRQVFVSPTDMLIPGFPLDFELTGKHSVWSLNELVLHFMEKPDSEAIEDSTGNEHTLTLTNITDANLAFSRIGRGIQFNGGSPSVETIEAPVTFPEEDFVIECLVQMRSGAPMSTRYGVCSILNPQIFGSVPCFSLELNDSDQWEFRVSDNLETETVVASSAIAFGQLDHLVAAFYITAAGARTVELFVNGASVGSGTLSQVRSNGTGDLLIGASYASDVVSHPLDGIIDEFHLYKQLPSTVAALPEWVASRNRMYKSVPDLITLEEENPEQYNDLWDRDPRIHWFISASFAPKKFAAVDDWEGKIYIAGGQTTGGAFTNTIFIYDLSTNSWTTGANMPATIASAGYGIIDGVFYVAGGNNGTVDVTTVYAYDIAGNSWSTVAALPVTISECSSAVLDGKLYLISGLHGGVHSPNIYSYDPIADSWTAELPLPTTGRSYSAAVAGNGAIFIYGGTTGSLFSDIIRLIPGNSSSQLTSAPQVRALHSLVYRNGKIYSLGGKTGSAASSQTEVVLEYDLLTGWTVSSIEVPQVVSGAPALHIDNIFYLVHGQDEEGGSYLDEIQAYLIENAVCPNSQEPRVKTPIPAGWYSSTGGGPSPSTYSPLSLADQRRAQLCGVLDDQIIIVGGQAASRYQDAIIYNPYTNQYKSIPDYPTNVVHCGYGVYDGKFWVMAAYTGSTSDECYYYDPALNQWVQVADVILTCNLGTGAWLDGKHYLHNGLNATAQMYDPATDTWTQIANPPTTYLAGASIGYQNELYINGGFPETATVIKYTPAADTWTTLNPFPEEATGTSLFVYNDELYCINPENDTSAADLTGKIWVYNKSLDSWSEASFSPMPIIAGLGGFALHGNRLHIFGGYTDRNPSLQHTDEHQVYNFVDGWI